MNIALLGIFVLCMVGIGIFAALGIYLIFDHTGKLNEPTTKFVGFNEDN
jgi:hypothetical protein